MSRFLSYVFTWNNYDESVEEYLRELSAVKYLVAGREIAPSTGTKHLQGLIVFKNARTLKSAVKILKGAHVEICRAVQSAILYCKKEGDFFEVGVAPLSRQQIGENEVRRWDLARQAAEEGRFSDIPSDIYFRYQNQAHCIYNRALEVRVFPDNDVLDNRWFCGPSGSGKSLTARKLFPDAFLKTKNKWWNGYTDQDAVIIDDVDPSHEAWIGAFLKEWSDHYRFQAEIKGSCRVIRPKTIIVTSQYTISEIFKDDETVSALKRRFHTTHFHLPL